MRFAVIGDFDSSYNLHIATNKAIEHSLNYLQVPLSFEWIGTDQILEDFEEMAGRYNGFWIAPGGPYASMNGALSIIRYARLHRIPVFGTCGGFQHMVIEFARNVLNMPDATHAEYDPYAPELIITPLSCSLASQSLDVVIIDKDSIVYRILGTDSIKEKYYCNYGLNPAYKEDLQINGFKTVGADIYQEARILELENHPFFIATLFIPQDQSTFEHPHKLVTAFLQAVAKHSNGQIHSSETGIPAGCPGPR